MITALLDNYIYQNRNTDKGLSEVLWKRVLDVNDRSLRSIVTGLGGQVQWYPSRIGLDITPASEIMAILCLSTSLEDLRRRIENILLGYTKQGEPFTVRDLGVRVRSPSSSSTLSSPIWRRRPSIPLPSSTAVRLLTSPTAATRSSPPVWHWRTPTTRSRRLASVRISVQRSSTTSSAARQSPACTHPFSWLPWRAEDARWCR